MQKIKKEQFSFQIPKNYNLRPVSRLKFNSEKPSIIFTAGPTGSGKSKLVEKTLELLYHKRTPPEFKEFLIDDFVENSQSYKASVDNIIQEFDCKTSRTDGKCNLITPSKNLLKAFERAYFQTRKNGPCTFKNSQYNQSCQSIYYKEIEDALKNQQNISIETTGKSIPTKWFHLYGERFLKDYNFIFVYSIVSFEELKKRNKQRAKRGIQKYMSHKESKSNPAPRLPDVSVEVFIKATTVINNTLIKLRNYCLRRGRPDQKDCGPINSSGRFVLLIFDNENKKEKLIYDSRTSDSFKTEAEFKEVIYKYALSLSK